MAVVNYDPEQGGLVGFFWTVVLVVFAVGIVGVMVFLVLLATNWFMPGAWGHEMYPKDCCQEQHCHPVPCNEIKYDGENYIWNDMIFRDIRDSPDGGCHVCHRGATPMCIMPGGVS
jgi:hypothetical protein